jgi:hypothetical protein
MKCLTKAAKNTYCRSRFIEDIQQLVITGNPKDRRTVRGFKRHPKVAFKLKSLYYKLPKKIFQYCSGLRGERGAAPSPGRFPGFGVDLAMSKPS